MNLCGRIATTLRRAPSSVIVVWMAGSLSCSFLGAPVWAQSLELPAFVVLDSEDKVVGQVVGFEEAPTAPWQPLVLVRRTEEKILMRLAREGNLQTPYRVYYEEFGCTGPAKMEFDSTNDPWAQMRGVIHGVGIGQVIYTAKESNPCVVHTVRSYRHPRHPLCIDEDSPRNLIPCAQAEPTTVDLDDLFVPPYRIE